MAIDRDTQSRLIDLLYGLLPEEEAVALRQRIDSDAELARAYAEAQQAAQVFGEAARIPSSPIAWRRPSETPPPPAARSKPGKPALAPWSPSTHWVIAAAAGALLVISLGGFFYQQQQLRDIAADHLRLRVSGPATLHAGVPGRYLVTTTTVTGEPVPAQVQFAVFAPGAGQLMRLNEKTDDAGRLEVTVPADFIAGSEARLEVSAEAEARSESFPFPARLAIEPVRYATELTLDKPRYVPGQTIHFRSLTLARFRLTPPEPTPLAFDILDSQGAVVPGSTSSTVTDQGVASGRFDVPPDMAEGEYTLRVRSLDGALTDRQRTFAIRDDETPDATAAKANFPDSDKIEIAFYPEGGRLVAGVQNRVYFTARNQRGEPVQIGGKIVVPERDGGLAVETNQAGMGAFTFDPQGDVAYRLVIDAPDHGGEAKLPTVFTQGVVLDSGLGVFEPGAPLGFNVRSLRRDVPLVAAATCRGVPVGQQPFVTDAGANAVTVTLDDDACGVIRLVIYDYSVSPPAPLAERLVYRRPQRHLQVHATSSDEQSESGQEAEISLTVTDEAGNPTKAALSLAVIDENVPSSDTGQMPSIPAYFLLTSELGNPEQVVDVGAYLADNPQSAGALGLLLGSQPVRPPAEWSLDDVSGKRLAALDEQFRPPAMFDNLGQLQREYQADLAMYRANRARALDALTALSFVGGLAILLLIAMVAVLKIASGFRVWVPSLAAAACLVIGVLLMSPKEAAPGRHDAVAFADFSAPLSSEQPAALAGEGKKALAQPAEAVESEQAAAKTAAPAAESPFTSRQHQMAGRAMRGMGGLSEQPAKSLADAMPAERGFIRKELAAERVQSRLGDGTLYWQPLLVTGDDGKATIRFLLPESVTSFRVIVDAHTDDGRLGSASQSFHATGK